VIALLLLLSCSPAREAAWTPDGALEGLRTALDRDADGRLDAPEWARSAPFGPDFARVDIDGDADVSARELVRLARGVDPSAWREATARNQPDRRLPLREAPRKGAPVEGPQAGPYLRWLREELLSVPGVEAAGIALPEAEAIEAVGELSLDDPAVGALLRALQRAYARAGQPFPEALLRREAPAR
jgi:hypothetical protein